MGKAQAAALAKEVAALAGKAKAAGASSSAKAALSKKLAALAAAAKKANLADAAALAGAEKAVGVATAQAKQDAADAAKSKAAQAAAVAKYNAMLAAHKKSKQAALDAAAKASGAKSAAAKAAAAYAAAVKAHKDKSSAHAAVISKLGFDLLETEVEAVCSIKTCPNICSIKNVVGEEENDLENDMATENEFGVFKKAIKWVQKKVCKPDAGCLAANKKCSATLAALKAQAAALAKEVAA